jgi:hypothetical protein
VDYRRFVAAVLATEGDGDGDGGLGDVVMRGYGERGDAHVFAHRLRPSPGGPLPRAPAGGGPLPRQFYFPSRATLRPAAAASAGGGPGAMVEGLRRQLRDAVWQRYPDLRAAFRAMGAAGPGALRASGGLGESDCGAALVCGSCAPRGLGRAVGRERCGIRVHV